MARGINKVTLVGNVGEKPEIVSLNGGSRLAKFSLATTHVRKDRDGNPVESTQWHRIKCFGKLADVVEQYVDKGKQLYIEGRIEYSTYEKEGITHYATDIICTDLQLLGAREGRSEDRSRRTERPRRDRAPAPQAEPEFNDDDIPF